VIIKRINQEIMPAIYAYGAMTVLTIIGSYVLIHKIGLVGIGISWVFGNSVVAGAVMVKMNLSIPRSRIRIFQICPFKVRRSS
jgi:O-antigen/teichoic acid export membrane protein